MMTIQAAQDAEQTYAQWIADEFSRHAALHGIDCKFQQFGFVARENDEIAGIITGHLYFNEAYVNDLVVSEKYRGQRIGTRLLQAVEEHCKKAHVETITLTTYAFQAPGFYEKQGFHVLMVQENKKDQRFTRYYYGKSVD